MDRRNFFKLFGAGVAGIALEQAIPLGRVWSFPREVIPVNWFRGGIVYYDRAALELLREKVDIGNSATIRLPQRFVVDGYALSLKHPGKFIETVELKQTAGLDIELIPAALPPFLP